MKKIIGILCAGLAIIGICGVPAGSAFVLAKFASSKFGWSEGSIPFLTIVLMLSFYYLINFFVFKLWTPEGRREFDRGEEERHEYWD